MKPRQLQTLAPVPTCPASMLLTAKMLAFNVYDPFLIFVHEGKSLYIYIYNLSEAMIQIKYTSITQKILTQSAGVVEYTDCISVEG